MSFINNIIDRMFKASWDRAHRNRDEASPLRSTIDGPQPGLNRTFTITEAINGSYISFQRRKYNPNGPDEYRHEVYLVQSGESLVDAISTVLVLTDKP